MGSLSIWHWLIVLAIIVLVSGTGKLKNLGKDLGASIKGFKEGMREGEESVAADKKEIAQDKEKSEGVIDVEAKDKTKSS